jgi:transcriptional regulator with XRE-family HTH domain
MSPRRSAPAHATAVAEARRVAVSFGLRVRDARLGRGWRVPELAARAGISADMVYRVEAGAAASSLTAARLAFALGRRLEIELVDPRRRARQNLEVDIVHSAMGEIEAGHLRNLGFGIGLDEPYQHFQFAGRADVVAWDVERRALLHLENRTRFPDFQDMAGAYNGKRAYLGASLATRVGIPSWASETHAMVVLWTAEVLHVLRQRAASFRALCPHDPSSFDTWWRGIPPTSGTRSVLVVLDPLARGRQERFIGLDRALTGRPRHRGYAEVRATFEKAP